MPKRLPATSAYDAATKRATSDDEEAVGHIRKRGPSDTHATNFGGGAAVSPKQPTAPLPDKISAQAIDVGNVFLADNKSETIDLLDVIKTPDNDDALEDAVDDKIIATAKRCPDTFSSSSSPPSPASCIRPACRHERPSPTNRDKFLAGIHVQSLGCSLDACTAGPTVRLTFTGTIVVLYPINFNPDRRYVVFMDENGFTGITIWSSNLKKIAANSIGKLCEISKVNISSHQGKKTINLSKESEVSNDILPNFLLTYVSRSQSKTKVCGGHLFFSNPLLPSWTYIRCPNTQSYPSLEFLATCVLKKKLSKLKPKGF